ncbi:hypothetical protein PF002_g27208 [Phytophthora fragariae]|uniref:Alpha-type protein kinase domain-containing protein n=1 Tax=Phytophthora fragariae TaxID=53985 RepID=A0A6A3HS00_9STRA|nr:hypothetical protein PF003_g29952 [Phytophthora fragariae]KAE8973339.1 hypothetical protein PF011_g25295 [Phytophthora fragariae]KAE9181661.1 hypothetical protein PF002_g27208 [Phytophthora fragariae]
MAAKFSMANTSGLFDSAAHVEASDRMQGAMEELKVKNDRQEKTRAQQLEQQEREDKQRTRRLEEALEAKAAQQKEDRSYVGQQQEDEELDSDDEAMLDELDEDPELERIRAARLKQLKNEFEEKQMLLAKGHGEFREITQDEFLKEVTGSPLVAVHFYHRDFERCKIMDMHLAKLARNHIECKFLKLNAEKAPFFVEKLAIRVLPTVVCFKDGVAFPERVTGFDGLTEDDEEAELANFGSRSNHHATSSDNFPTAALARKLVEIGAIREKDEGDEGEQTAKEASVASPRSRPSGQPSRERTLASSGQQQQLQAAREPMSASAGRRRASKPLPPGDQFDRDAPLAVAVAYPAPVPSGPPPSTHQSPFEKLNTLKLLLDCGHLTADEYQERKTQIINEMTGTSTERKKPSPRSRRSGSGSGNPAPPPPLQPLLKTVVPHGPPDFSRIRRERADKLSFDVDTLEWHSTPVRVKLDLVPFATGQLRNAYYLQELGADGSPSRLLVAKVSLRPAEPSTYLSDVEMQAVCAHYAALYNEHEPPLKVCYARSWLLKLRDRERGTLVCSVEEFLPGAYVKYSNNSGYVGRETSTTEERERNTPQAFSHFSFVASDFRLMIVDIQGVADSYTDPQIHSADGRGFGVGNLGTFGMEKFLESHRCNEVCRWLGLRSINEQYKPGGTAAPGYEMPFGGAIKKSTNRITEERNTFSTSVTVSEAFGDTATAEWTEREDSRLESGDDEDEDEEDEEDEEDPGEHSDSTSYATDSSPAMSGLHPRYPKAKRQKRLFSSAASSRGRGGGSGFDGVKAVCLSADMHTYILMRSIWAEVGVDTRSTRGGALHGRSPHGDSSRDESRKTMSVLDQSSPGKTQLQVDSSARHLASTGATQSVPLYV